MTAVRVALPAHLRTLAGVGKEVRLEVPDAPTILMVVEALERRYPMLKGTVRDHGSERRRDYLRFFACGDDLSHESMHSRLPAAVESGNEAFYIVGAIAGGRPVEGRDHAVVRERR